MNQESNTENNSKPRPKLSLRKTPEGSDERAPISGALNKSRETDADEAANPSLENPFDEPVTPERPPLKINQHPADTKLTENSPSFTTPPQPADDDLPPPPTLGPDAPLDTITRFGSQQGQPPAGDLSALNSDQVELDSFTAPPTTPPSSGPPRLRPPQRAADTGNRDSLFEEAVTKTPPKKHAFTAIGGFILVAALIIGAISLIVVGLRNFGIDDKMNEWLSTFKNGNETAQTPPPEASDPPSLESMPLLFPTSQSEPPRTLPPAINIEDIAAALPNATPEPAQKMLPPVQKTVELPPVNAKPNPEVVKWIDQMRINGVSNQRIFIDNKLFQLGQVVNPDLGITWSGVDDQLEVLYFQDKQRVRYEKDY